MNLRVFQTYEELVVSLRDTVRRVSRREISYSVGVGESSLAADLERANLDRVRIRPETSDADLVIWPGSGLAGLPNTEIRTLFVVAKNLDGLDHLEDVRTLDEPWVFTTDEVWRNLGGAERRLERDETE